MGEWIEKSMDEIAEFNPRETIKKGSVAKKIAMDKLRPFCRDVPGFELEPFWGGTKFRNGDTIMARITPCLENGKTAKVDVLDEDEVGFGSTEYIVFRAREGNDADFIYYLVSSPVVREPAIKSMVGSSGRQRVQNDVVQKLRVMVPKLEGQQAIAGILKLLDDKIAVNQKINDNLEQQARALYRSIVDSASHSAVLSDFMTIKHGYAFKGNHITFENNNVVLVTPGNFKIGGGFQERKCKYFTSEYPNEYILHPGDLIVTMTDLSKEADTLGYSALIPNNPERIYLHNQRIGLVQFTNNNFPKDYVYWFLRSYDYHVRIVGSASGSTVKHTSPDRILEQTIPVPQNEEKAKILILKDIDETIAHNELENIKLSNIRDSILPRLMSGEIDVSEIQL